MDRELKALAAGAVLGEQAHSGWPPHNANPAAMPPGAGLVGTAAMNAAQETVTCLERQVPLWQVWVVHRFYGVPCGCARRWDDETLIVNAGSADELAE